MAIIYDMAEGTTRPATGKDYPGEKHYPVPTVEPALEPAVASLEEHRGTQVQGNPSVHVIRAALEKVNKI